jgi:hypothetical protein
LEIPERILVEAICTVGPSLGLIREELSKRIFEEDYGPGNFLTVAQVRKAMNGSRAARKAYDDFVETISKVMRDHSIPSRIADLFEVKRSVVMAWINENARLSQDFVDAYERRVDLAEQNLDVALAFGERWATELVLTTQGAKRGFGQRIQHIGVDQELEQLGPQRNEIVAELVRLLEVAQGSVETESSDPSGQTTLDVVAYNTVATEVVDEDP